MADAEAAVAPPSPAAPPPPADDDASDIDVDELDPPATPPPLAHDAPAPTEPAVELDPLFSAADNDIVLVSSDGRRLGFRRVFLEAASDVFADMGLVGASGSSAGAGPAEEEVVVPVAEDAALLQAFLLFLHPGAADPEIKTYDELERCVLARVP